MNKLTIGLLATVLGALAAPAQAQAPAKKAPTHPIKKTTAKATTRAGGVANAVAAQVPTAPKEAPPVGSAPRDFALPAKEDFTLDNGLRARLVPYGQVPKATMMVAIQAGNVHEGPDAVDLADLLAKLLREGTATLSATQLADKVARMGGSLDISAGSDQTLLWASCLSEYAPDLAALLADVVQHPALPASEIARLKTDMKRGVNLLRAQPVNQADVKMRGAVYAGHPYGRPHPTDAQLDALTLAQVQNFYKTQYGARRTSLYVAGRFDAPALRQAITAAWGPWAPGPVPRIEAARSITKAEVLTQDRPDAPQSTLIIGLPAADPTSPDYVRLRVTNSLLGGSFGSRITRNIREDKGYTYSPYSAVVTKYHTGLWVEVADVTTKDTYNSLHEIVNEIERLQKTPPSADELKGIQNYESGMFVLRNSNPGGIISQLNNLDLQGLPDSFLTEQVKNINAVTPAQVSATARQYIRPEAMTIVVVGDQKVVAPQIKKFQDSLKKPL